MLDRVTGMQVFARVATSGSFSAAARQLGLSQTMVTKHVAAIEVRLGVKLFHRSTRRLTLTEAGRRYLEACERILADIEEAEALAARDRVEPRGTLRLNVPLSFGVREVAPALADFARAYPAVSVDRTARRLTSGGPATCAVPHHGLCGARLPGRARHAADRGRPRRP
jgi:DNA-binding transcriptional LysR family regulator